MNVQAREIDQWPEMVKRVVIALGVAYLQHDGSMEALARAAIEAMREPTEGMLDSGWHGLPDVAPAKGDYPEENAVMIDIWHNMIDAALGLR